MPSPPQIWEFGNSNRCFYCEGSENKEGQTGRQVSVSVGELLPCQGQPTLLQQVFVNLLANANKFAPEGSVVRIGAEAHDTRVLCWVEDEGPGPAASETDAIFARFQRGSEEEPEPGGLGLGLWIVKSIIDRHAGTITLVRTEQGRTRFTLSLPRELSE